MRLDRRPARARPARRCRSTSRSARGRRRCRRHRTVAARPSRTCASRGAGRLGGRPRWSCRSGGRHARTRTSVVTTMHFRPWGKTDKAERALHSTTSTCEGASNSSTRTERWARAGRSRRSASSSSQRRAEDAGRLARSATRPTPRRCAGLLDDVFAHSQASDSRVSENEPLVPSATNVRRLVLKRWPPTSSSTAFLEQGTLFLRGLLYVRQAAEMGTVLLSASTQSHNFPATVCLASGKQGPHLEQRADAVRRAT